MNTAATAIDSRPKTTQQLLAELARARRDADLVRPQDAQEGAVQQRPGQQRGDHRGRFAVGVGQPGVHRRQPHLGAVADQEEQERRLEPGRRSAGLAPGEQGRPGTSTGRAAAVRRRRRRGDRQQEVAQQRQRDADRADQQVFPGRFERAVVPMEVDQRALASVVASTPTHSSPKCWLTRHQRHRRQEQQQAAGEHGLGLVAEEQVLDEIDVAVAGARRQVADAIERREPETGR